MVRINNNERCESNPFLLSKTEKKKSKKEHSSYGVSAQLFTLNHEHFIPP
ncbi:Uncharacterized protein APZ42_025729 [Daphnia magna]|uniref:Uncharacterized protein n=1 Tax=Daphnia magna TaxID=35525 RepID=A0A164ST17_9CRUS|nr:Uncharacterized protein APZ42_025729 [Daphnia magna]